MPSDVYVVQVYEPATMAVDPCAVEVFLTKADAERYAQSVHAPYEILHRHLNRGEIEADALRPYQTP